VEDNGQVTVGISDHAQACSATSCTSNCRASATPSPPAPPSRWWSR
jgi:hypothetical protein